METVQHLLSNLNATLAIGKDTHTHTHPFNGPFPGRPGWADTRKVKPLWILQKQETVSGRGISWAICKSEPRSRQITMPAPHHSVFYRLDALPATNQQRQSTEGKYIWPVTPCSNKIFQFIIGGAANTSCPVYQSQKKQYRSSSNNSSR